MGSFQASLLDNENQKIVQALSNDLSDIHAIMNITPQEKSDDSPVVQENNVIDSYEVADAVFTTKYLYCAAKETIASW